MITNVIVSSVPKTVKPVTADDMVDTAPTEAGGFVASPSSIVFTNYIPGQTYTVSYKHCISVCILLCVCTGNSSTNQ